MTTALIDHGRMLEALGGEGRLLVAAAREADPEVPVEGVSGRTVRQTLSHVVDLYQECLKRLTGSDRAPWNSGQWEDESAEVDVSGVDVSEVTDRLADRLAELLAEFGTRPADRPCQGWWPEGGTAMEVTGASWLRRMVHATTVHRVDVQGAAATGTEPIDTDVAHDGIDEVLRLWFGYRLRTLGVRPGRTWAVGVFGDERSWVAEASRETTSVSRTDADRQFDATIRGRASTVYLWLWGRLPDRALKITGDREATAQLWSLLQLAQH